MRRFVVIGHRAPTTPDINLNDLAGSSGRLDVLLRCVANTFFLSNDFRRDAELALVLLAGDDPPRTIRFRGDRMRYLNPDERSTAALVRNALIQARGRDGDVDATPGITVHRWGLREELERAAPGSLVMLHEQGAPLAEATLPAEPTFVLSDDREFTDDDQAALNEREPVRVSLGGRSYLSSQCITMVHWHLDGRV